MRTGAAKRLVYDVLQRLNKSCRKILLDCSSNLQSDVVSWIKFADITMLQGNGTFCCLNSPNPHAFRVVVFTLQTLVRCFLFRLVEPIAAVSNHLLCFFFVLPAIILASEMSGHMLVGTYNSEFFL